MKTPYRTPSEPTLDAPRRRDAILRAGALLLALAPAPIILAVGWSMGSSPYQSAVGAIGALVIYGFIAVVAFATRWNPRASSTTLILGTAWWPITAAMTIGAAVRATVMRATKYVRDGE